MAEIEEIFDLSADPSEEEQRFSELNRYKYGVGSLTELIREYLNRYGDDIYLIRMQWGGGFMSGNEYIEVSKKFRDMETFAVDVSRDRPLSVSESPNGQILGLELYTIYKFEDSSMHRKDTRPPDIF
ncbi:MAG: hypothetical protein LBH69_05030 [Methanomassiliicoccaceae archaeon]|nr:hypothetical protein [Methanomassiliicoccaceae archaeon]